MPEGNPLIWYVLYLDENGKKSYEIFTGNSQNEIQKKIEAFAESMDMAVHDFILFCDTDVKEEVTACL